MSIQHPPTPGLKNQPSVVSSLVSSYGRFAARYKATMSIQHHPTPSLKNQPSVASLIRSYDRFVAQYEAMTSIQCPRLVFESPVRSGFWVPGALTETETGLDLF